MNLGFMPPAYSNMSELGSIAEKEEQKWFPTDMIPRIKNIFQLFLQLQ